MHTTADGAEAKKNRKGKLITEIVDEEGLSVMNNGDPTFMSFAKGMQSALSLTIATPDLYT
jgi:hypothetical protein